MKHLLLWIATSMISGCMSNAALQVKRIEFKNTIPTCHSDRECELKWSAARRWVLHHADSKIQHITNDFIETYNPAPNSPHLAVRVVKEPMTEGGYRFTVTTWCDNLFGCQPNSWDAAIDFNKYVGAVRGK